MFEDRTEAGERLADALEELELPDPVVMALPRGGLPVALPVARRLGAPLELLLVRKIGLPGSPEFAAGAIVDTPDGGEAVFNTEVLRAFGMRESDFDAELAEKRKELDARRRRFMGGRMPTPVAGRSAVIVDDGIATGATVRAALAGLKSQDPARIVLAVPVAPPDTVQALRGDVDHLICLDTPRAFQAVSLHYRSFDQVSDDTVAQLMETARAEHDERTSR
ncbi:phosphoribosyl transferase [Rhodobacteraceae bacterium WD3A24]|nr:phosphoribosyl transferase [Rhodobacteraceae bacterium WD3A24]